MNNTAVWEMVDVAYEGYPQWYRKLNADAREREEKIGWPEASEEPWRRSDLKRVKLDALYRGKPTEPDIKAGSLKNSPTPGSTDGNPRIAPLGEAIAGDYPGVRELLEAQAKAADNRFILRLLSETPRGRYFYLPRNYSPPDIFVLEDQLKGPKLCHCKTACDCQSGDVGETFTLNLVVLEKKAQMELWERIGTPDSKVSVHNRATLFLLQDGAKLRYYRTQTLPEESQLFDFSRALLNEGAELHACQAEKELRFNKSHIVAELRGRRAQAKLRGIYHITGSFFNEIFTEQIHRAPECVSQSLYRGVLEDEARAVYNGMINVSPEAVGTDAYLANNNLLINDGCRADSIPGLKISTNEVKCSHGSTTGKVNPNQIYYLTSRGFSPEGAKEILTQAFLEEVLEDVPPRVKVEIGRHWPLKWKE